ncbi:MAG: transglutaminaseTgpA domain-containing protein [Granulosicoccus sp.]
MNAAALPSWRRLLPSIGSLHADNVPPRTLYALAILLMFVKLPHLPHLPLWVSAAGISLVTARLALLKYPSAKLLQAILSPLSVTVVAATSAVIIKWHYGYFLGRDPCVAFLFILVAAKYAEIRRTSDATLLLCLCAFLLLTHYFYSQSIVSAILTLPAVTALAYSLCVLRDAKNPESTARQLKLIGVLMIQGLPLAALLFVVFPRLPGPLWSLPEDSMATTGLSGSMSPGSIGNLSQSDAVAFRVEFDGAVPSAEQLYWRGPVLTEFDGRNWDVSKFRFEAKPSYNGPRSDVLDYVVTLQPHRQRWLFALENAASLPSAYNTAQGVDRLYSQAIGTMYGDGQILADDNVSQALRYRQSSVLSSSFPAAEKPRRQTLHLPGKNQRTIRFARQLRSGHSSDTAYANAVMQHFYDQPFSYTLRPQLLGDTPVDEFLFDSREGFCEHYAAAFVVMMRAAGIPSRVVTGYQGGEMNEDYMIVRQSDAHAWAEAYLQGSWQRFDPTSAVAPSRIENGLAAALPGEASVPRLARQTPGFIRDMQLRWDAINHNWQRLVIDFDNDSQANLWERAGLGKPAPWHIALAVIVLAGLWSALVLGMPARRTRDLTAQERYWQQLSRLLQSRMTHRRHNESSGEFLRRAAALWPSQKLRFERLDASFTRSRFMLLDRQEHTTLIKQIRKDVLSLYVILPLSRKLQRA